MRGRDERVQGATEAAGPARPPRPPCSPVVVAAPPAPQQLELGCLWRPGMCWWDGSPQPLATTAGMFAEPFAKWEQPRPGGQRGWSCTGQLQPGTNGEGAALQLLRAVPVGSCAGDPGNYGVELPWAGPALALTCSWEPTFWTQGSGRAGGAAVDPRRVGPVLQAPALTPSQCLFPQGCCRLRCPSQRTREAQPCGPHHPLAGRARSLPS